MNAFIILNYNDCDNCIRLATAVSAFACIDKVIVVDNCSTDDSVFKLRQIECDKIKLVITEKNGGYSYGNNRGAEYAINELHADKLVFSNTDIIIEEDALSASLNVVGKDDIAYCAPLMQYSYKNEPEPLAEYSSNWFSSIMKKTIIGTAIRKLHNSKKHPEEIHDVNITCGALFVITTASFITAGMFDENVFLYYEEEILFYKLKNNNFRTVLDGTHRYIHQHGVTINKKYDRYKRFKLRMNSEKYFWFEVVKINRISKLIFMLLSKVILFERFICYKILQK